jgi:predicted nucleotidyltransferase component of viral defense system
MLHKDKADFIRTLNHVAMQTGFILPLVEKDYYLTLILLRLHQLSPDLIFKGGTCLNKIYFSAFRLSEDLNFTMRLPQDAATRGMRRKCIQPVKDKIESFAAQFDMNIDDIEKAGGNESKQYIYYFRYQSFVLPAESKIKFEIGLRFNPICEPEKKKVRHGFLHPFTGKPLFEGGEVNCLVLKELVAEKLRAAATRETIAPRDFYDIDFVLRKGFDLTEPEVLKLFQKKLVEDGADTDLSGYRANLGRKDKEIQDMKKRIKEELFEVLTPAERKRFDLDAALKRINKAFHKIRK